MLNARAGFRGAENGQFSVDLTEAVGRVIAVSYGVTKMARRSFVVPLEKLRAGAGPLLTKIGKSNAIRIEQLRAEMELLKRLLSVRGRIERAVQDVSGKGR